MEGEIVFYATAPRGKEHLRLCICQVATGIGSVCELPELFPHGAPSHLIRIKYPKYLGWKGKTFYRVVKINIPKGLAKGQHSLSIPKTSSCPLLSLTVWRRGKRTRFCLNLKGSRYFKNRNWEGP